MTTKKQKIEAKTALAVMVVYSFFVAFSLSEQPIPLKSISSSAWMFATGCIGLFSVYRKVVRLG
ncbi:MAG: hypothetical protein HOP23_11295 [Methylococcaceae bacterium]|nr:hypothetical protein [Methylococcaceae bacterium]